jgi:heptosyltransferase-2
MRQLASRKRKRTLHPESVQVVGAIELTRLGDTLSAIPVIRALRRFFPHAMIHVVVDNAHAPLLDALQLGIQVLGVKDPTSARSLYRTSRYLRGFRPDIAISLSPSKRNAFLALSSASRKQAGYLSYIDTLTPHLEETPVEGFGFVPIAQSTYGRESIHERSAKILNVMGGAHHLRLNSDPVSLRNEEALYQNLLARKVLPSEDYVVIHPFAGWEYRRWDPARFARLGRSIISDYDTEVVYLSDNRDQDGLFRLSEQFRDEPRARFVSFLSLMESAVLIHRSSLFIGNDSGPLHLAALFGVPLVGLFGPAPPELTAPRSSESEFLYRKVECSPCAQRVCERPDESCMTLIEQDEVMRAVGRFLHHSRARVVAHG